FRNCWLNWQRTTIAGRLRKRSKNICSPKQEKILTKPSQEKEHTLCRTFFLTAESVFSTKAICSLQKKNSWRGSMKPPDCRILKVSRKPQSPVITTWQLRNRGLAIPKRRCPGSDLLKKNRKNLVELCFPKSLLLV